MDLTEFFDGVSYFAYPILGLLVGYPLARLIKAFFDWKDRG